MIINENSERECCEFEDLLPYHGKMADWLEKNKDRYKPKFCKYCGQIFYHSKEMGPSGSMEPCLMKLYAGSAKEETRS